MRLYNIKHDLHAASGVWIVEQSNEEQMMEAAFERGEAVIVEVAATDSAVTIHSLSRDDINGFGSLSAWATFQCAGREAAFDSMFYRIDVKPMERAREFLAGGGSQNAIWLSGPLKVSPEPVTEEDDNEEGGPASAPVLVRPRPPRGR